LLQRNSSKRHTLECGDQSPLCYSEPNARAGPAEV
jgi:hypothetical protein